MTTRKGDDVSIVAGSGNVFRDLEVRLTAEDEIRLGVAREIARAVRLRGYSQREAAAVLGVDQAKVSQILRGRLAGLSVERLLKYLLLLGVDIDVHFSPPVPGLSDGPPEEGRVTFHSPAMAAE